MSAKKQTTTHLHKLRRHTYKNTGNSVFFCTLNDCTFKTETQFMIGKITLCNRCGSPFEMTSYAVSLSLPHCKACHRPMKGNKNVESIVDSLASKLIGEASIEDRRTGLPSRRELDPTVIQDNAELSISSLQERLSGTLPTIQYRELKVEDEDVEL